MADQQEPGEVESAVSRTLAGLEEVSPLHEGLTALSRVLARKLDNDAGMATAAVARELRSTLEALADAGGDGDSDALADLVAHLSSPVGDAQE
ncbi:hypothetical protein [Actinomadura rupiterrae]|uniref:hypothetical protein n=1 Tax=Actinomadura rupiterrae TaxID=559627 RepID=UPI0020A29D6F|nr:hypothetical protein [Actinomadura rupiterrae]MCP2339178.1 hypothetical protein [Actinomadura rupiterrae]